MLAKQLKKDQNKLGMGVHTRNPRSWEEDAEGLEVQNHPPLRREFEASLGNMRFCLNPTPIATLKKEFDKVGCGFSIASSGALQK